MSLGNMNSLPGPSKIKYHCPDSRHDSNLEQPEQPRKKFKVEEDDDVRYQRSSRSINDLPNEMLIKVFGYLGVVDKLNAEKVCNGWNQLLRSEIFWKHLNLSNISNSLFIKILASLPACVSQLRFVCRSEALPISLPEVMGKLHDQCPLLESFYLEKIGLVKNLRTVPSHQTRRSEFFNTMLIEDAKSTLEECANQVIESEFRNEEDIGLDCAVLPALQILSLRRVLFCQFHISSHITAFVLPKLVVLDLSYSKPLSLKETCLFSSLPDLEELYLAGWKISDITIMNFIRNSKKLRVLDLENCNVTDKTVSALKHYCTRLEELYLGFCLIGDISRTVEDEDFFPRLKTLCLKYSKVTQKGVERLVTDCPSLKLVYVGNPILIKDSWYRELPEDFKEKIQLSSNKIAFYCDHFSKTKYYKF